jgi:hypothetical protein
MIASARHGHWPAPPRAVPSPPTPPGAPVAVTPRKRHSGPGAPTVLALLIALASTARPAGGQQVFTRMGGGGEAHADPNYKATVAHPAYGTAHPRVLLDEAHRETNTKAGPYGPFADLLAADGYTVSANGAFFDAEALQGVAVLVIPNARGSDDPRAAGMPALAPDEVDAVATWVEGGGSLLLVGDEAMFADAAEALAKRLGVDLPGGRALDSTHADTAFAGRATLEFSDANHLLGDHPILQGRDPGERVHRVLAFGAEALTGPPGSAVLLRLSDQALEVPATTAAEMKAKLDAALADAQSRGGQVQIRLQPPAAKSAAGRAAGVAFAFGKGRVVVLGDAAMLSAQVLASPDGQSRAVGFGVPGTDDQQFALNVLHWLSRLY